MADSRKFRVLIVDDAGLARAYYRDILERNGYQVDEALNGVEALEKLLQDPPDFMVVDVNMPQMDGVTFLKILRRQIPALASTPAIIATRSSATSARRSSHRRRSIRHSSPAASRRPPGWRWSRFPPTLPAVPHPLVRSARAHHPASPDLALTS